jgi:hypothetical protein
MSGDLVPHFPDHIRLTARSLSLAGYSSDAVATRLATLYPDDDPPSSQTIRRWRATQAELSTEESEAQSQLNREIALVASMSVLQDLQSAPERITATQKMVISGIAQSKEHERLQRNTQPQIIVPIQIILTSPDTD